jgi:hypothetical protein
MSQHMLISAVNQNSLSSTAQFFVFCQANDGPCMEGIMRESAVLLLTVLVCTAVLSGCEIVGDIFQAGVWVRSASGYRGDRACCLAGGQS